MSESKQYSSDKSGSGHCWLRLIRRCHHRPPPHHTPRHIDRLEHRLLRRQDLTAFAGGGVGGFLRLSVKDRMVRSIALRKGEVVLRADFEAMGSPSQISRAIKVLIEAGKIVRLGYGVYAKARPSTLSGKPVPRVSLEELAQEALEKLGVPVQLGRAQADYAEGKTTQVPVRTTFNTGQRRISRKITVGISTVRYENHYSARA